MTEHTTAETAQKPPPGTVDPRSPRFGAAITALLLLVGTYLSLIGTSAQAGLGALPLSERIADPGFVLLTIVALLFAWSLVSARTHPFPALFRAVVRPRLGPPSEWEDHRPPRFAQLVGLIVVGVGLVLHLIGVPWALVIAGAAAFVAAFLNAAFGFCLGCELYLLLVRAKAIRPSRPIYHA
ncbi:DUF4395 domain-containing protein [Leucobacter weissii]|uniref:DUF4395 domain-containing protein n=1 Tax=Leucobacter weissii TaxID=1983706 RepID=A0A939MIT5_9MICO|nr:DUF4395 domain-containing protein [Leucobacter weissii]MBO1901366.1 DUF4395 domain-containing protein [Leucobacter weissii]